MFQLLIDSQTQQKFILDNVELLKDILTYITSSPLNFHLQFFPPSFCKPMNFQQSKVLLPIRINVYIVKKDPLQHSIPSR